MTRQPTHTHTRRGRGRGVLVSGYSRTARLDLPEGGEGTLPRPIPESALYPTVARHLNHLGFTCWRDVSFLGRWIDLYALNEASGRAIAVELKVSDWRRALTQARIARGSADEAWVALWAPYVHRALTPGALGAFADAGVGIMSVNGECRVKLQPRPSEARYRAHIILPSRCSHRPR